MSALTAEELAALSRQERQRIVVDWGRRAFGDAQMASPQQRAVRLLEEAIEAYQACGAPRAMAHRLVDFVFDRPPGEVGQELGGVAVTLLALAHASGLDADGQEVTEIARCLSKDPDHYAKRNAAKNAAGFDAIGEAAKHRRALYFGCWKQAGHYLFDESGAHVDGRDIEVVDGVHLDGSYAPKIAAGGAVVFAAQDPSARRDLIRYNAREAPEGQFLRHERGGFTLIQWWDRHQGDTRGACNGTFLLEGGHDSATMLAELGARFPHVVENLRRAGIELVELYR
jgi:hypothetical protein